MGREPGVKALTLRSCDFDAVASAHLRGLGHATDDDIAWAEREASIGRVSVIGVFAGEKRVMTVLLSVADEAEGRVLRIISAAGKCRGVDLTRAVLPKLAELAANDGCKVVRVSTADRAMARKLMRLGFVYREAVFEREVA